VQKINPLLDWVESEFGFKPVVYYSFFGGKQEDGLIKAIDDILKKTDDCELAAIDAIAGAAHSLIIAIGIFRGKLQIEEAIELIRIEEDLQVLIIPPSFSNPFFAHRHEHLMTLGCSL
jgi:ATP synthase F1 complex assembly factor 2